MVLELVGWVLDPIVVAILWHLYRRSEHRWWFLATYAFGYLAVTAHYLLPDFATRWPSAADRGYFVFLLLVGAALLVLALVKVLSTARKGKGVSAAT